VAAEVAAIFKHLPFIKKVWAPPCTGGKAKLTESLPFVRALRKAKFDLSIDFFGNDRGGILSLLVGAKSRLSAIEGAPFFTKTRLYQHRSNQTPFKPTCFRLVGLNDI
jgi:ADP-heptose:LPS heptosyltransferase